MKNIPFRTLFLLFLIAIYYQGSLLAYNQEFAQDQMMAVSADHIEYGGDSILLNGHATIEHPLGILAADLMTLQSETKIKNRSFDHLQLDGHVDIALKEGGQLFCSKAILDYVTLSGDFSGGDGKENVIYRKTRDEKNGDTFSLIIESKKMQLQLSKKRSQTMRSEHLAIDKIRADGDLSIHYNDRFNATADRALFQQSPEKLFASKDPLLGQILLSCYSPERLCYVTSAEGDEIKSSEIFIDTTLHEWRFAFPKGTFKVAAGGYGPLDFSADQLVWDDSNSKLILSGRVNIAQQGIGNVQAEKEMRLILSAVKGKKTLRGIETKGETVLIYTDQETGLEHKLKSYGSLRIDHEKMEIKLQSPDNGSGSAKEGHQVFFKDAQGEIYADKAFVKYAYRDQKIVPIRIVLQGHVKIINSLQESEDDLTKINQYLLADRVDFIPETKQMIFKAAKDQRVLLFDKAHNLEVSAQGLKLIRDLATNKETVEGVGDVRFSFIDSEFDQLRRHFSFEKMSDGS